MRQKNRNLRVESLETRQLLAGNVTVDLFPSGSFKDDVRVRGDSLGNQIEIFELSEGTYRISGMTSNGAKTTVNGKAFVDIRSPHDDLRIDMGGGNDVVFIGNSSGRMTVEDLTVDMGAGKDILVLGNLEVYDRSDNAKLNLGTEAQNEADGLLVFNTTFKAGVDIVMGGGADEIAFTGFTGGASNSSVTKKLSINTGSGADKVTLDGVRADEIYASFGSGDDTLSMKNNTANKFTADGSAGIDKILIDTGNNFRRRSVIGF